MFVVFAFLANLSQCATENYDESSSFAAVGAIPAFPVLLRNLQIEDVESLHLLSYSIMADNTNNEAWSMKWRVVWGDFPIFSRAKENVGNSLTKDSP